MESSDVRRSLGGRALLPIGSGRRDSEKPPPQDLRLRGPLPGTRLRARGKRLGRFKVLRSQKGGQGAREPARSRERVGKSCRPPLPPASERPGASPPSAHRARAGHAAVNHVLRQEQDGERAALPHLAGGPRHHDPEEQVEKIRWQHHFDQLHPQTDNKFH
ncbi:hypothetical protein J1605_008383 [Eschrichtius robustus]|uniref:Uncharacterized protein n=1 Tax=Eschrichtius robustus TaxID=9764 RepID=A0AB34GUT7_ESCRO|nr:hypothetical protein J1605_008383 [Eschrichtius robustus]